MDASALVAALLASLDTPSLRATAAPPPAEDAEVSALRSLLADAAVAAGGTDSEWSLRHKKALSHLLHDRGRFADAEQPARDVLAGFRRLHGDDDRATLDAIEHLARLLKKQERFEEADPLYREGLAGFRRVFGDEHVDTLVSIFNYARFLEGRGDIDAAEPLFREEFESVRRVNGDAHEDTRSSARNLLRFYTAHAKPAEAAALTAAFENLVVDGPPPPPTDDADALRQTLLALTSMLSLDQAGALLAAGAPPALVRAVRAHAENADVCRDALHLIFLNLMTLSPERAAECLGAGATITFFSDVLTRHASDELVAAFALRVITKLGAVAHRESVLCGFPAVVSTVMRLHAHSVEVSTRAIAAINNVVFCSVNRDYLVAIESAGVIERLCTCLRLHAANSDICERAVWALMTLVSESDEARNACSTTASLLALAAAAVQTHPTTAKLCSKAASFFHAIALHSSLQRIDALYEAGVLPALAIIMKTHFSGDTRMWNEAFETLEVIVGRLSLAGEATSLPQPATGDDTSHAHTLVPSASSLVCRNCRRTCTNFLSCTGSECEWRICHNCFTARGTLAEAVAATTRPYLSAARIAAPTLFMRSSKANRLTQKNSYDVLLSTLGYDATTASGLSSLIRDFIHDEEFCTAALPRFTGVAAPDVEHLLEALRRVRAGQAAELSLADVNTLIACHREKHPSLELFCDSFRVERSMRVPCMSAARPSCTSSLCVELAVSLSKEKGPSDPCALLGDMLRGHAGVEISEHLASAVAALSADRCVDLLRAGVPELLVSALDAHSASDRVVECVTCALANLSADCAAAEECERSGAADALTRLLLSARGVAATARVDAIRALFLITCRLRAQVAV